jgi:predicted RNA-binding protein YlxR (DUF448 family)
MRVPERTCVGCRRRAPKPQLLRLVAGDEGIVRADPGAVLPGRGAYVHRDPACLEDALRRGAIARALRTSLDERGAATLKADIEGEQVR